MSSRVRLGYSLKISSIESPAPRNSRTVCTVRDARSCDGRATITDIRVNNDTFHISIVARGVPKAPLILN